MSSHQQEASRGPEMTPAVRGSLHPGDHAAPGTPSTGEDLCPECGGNGTVQGAGSCPACGGTGKVIVPVSAGE